MEKQLHIICLNVPYPVDYGGVFDLYFKLVALKQQGVKIHLHCFEYGRGEQPKLKEHCFEVHYYRRLNGLKAFSGLVPYIVASRKNEELTQRLLQDDFPILMEGVHCTFLLNDKRFGGRKCFVRLHNVEHIYYRNLFTSARFGFKKIYYWLEAQLLSRYEKLIINKAIFLTVSQQDKEIYEGLGCRKAIFLPLFLPQWKVETVEGMGNFCLYQGDLSVDENQKGALWLLKRVFNDLEVPFVIAGKNPPQRLKKLVEENQNVCLVANPNEQEMQDLISKAHIHVIPSFNATGIKLKLINALFNGRHCVVNPATVKGSGLEDLCNIATDANAFKDEIKALFNVPIKAEELKKRAHLLNGMFDNDENAKKLLARIWQQ